MTPVLRKCRKTVDRLRMEGASMAESSASSLAPGSPRSGERRCGSMRTPSGVRMVRRRSRWSLGPDPLSAFRRDTHCARGRQFFMPRYARLSLKSAGRSPSVVGRLERIGVAELALVAYVVAIAFLHVVSSLADLRAEDLTPSWRSARRTGLLGGSAFSPTPIVCDRPKSPHMAIRPVATRTARGGLTKSTLETRATAGLSRPRAPL
jgi:hypothetical protein